MLVVDNIWIFVYENKLITKHISYIDSRDFKVNIGTQN